jgi:hypothetical protein
MPLSVMAALLLLLSGTARAAIYDDFTVFKIEGYDVDKWTADGTGFTQPGDGHLHYKGTGPSTASLVSTSSYTSGFFTMPFADYFSDNNAPGGRGLGSVAALGLGHPSGNQWVRIERGQVRGDPKPGVPGNYIEVNWNSPRDPRHIFVNWVESDISSGFLQLRYDGLHVTFFYRTLETDPWTQMVVTNRVGRPVLDANNRTQPLIVTPDWKGAVPMFIRAIPGGTLSDHFAMTFRVDNVDVTSATDILPPLAGPTH